MHTEMQLEQIKNEISRDIQNALGSKLHKIILYGSYARGDYNEDSDIDIMVLADIEEYETRFFKTMINEVAHRVSLEYNALVTIFLKDVRSFYRHLEILPYYQNVINEGVEIHGR
ncbi:MAG: nucleotidyltransferase domain-containing protein [Oscillospiraceae bacterium]|nr:nucleotidyltransferase domain-containing protein [Oscillospiraceae bacterium]